MHIKTIKNNFIYRYIFCGVLLFFLTGCGDSGEISVNIQDVDIQDVPAPPPSSPETSAILTWNASTQNADSTTCVTDHDGYNIYYGTDSINLVNRISDATVDCFDTEVETDCGNIHECTYTVSSLTTGSWYFGVTSIDAYGNESDLSNIDSKDIL